MRANNAEIACPAKRQARSRREKVRLDTAIAELATLLPDEQERIGKWILELLRDETEWDTRFGSSQSALGQLAAEARADRASGRASELDFERR